MSATSRRRVGLRLGWGVLDQGVSSLENFLLGVFVAREMGAANLGILAIILFTYGLVLNGARGVATDPLMVRYSGVTGDRWRHAVGSAVGTSLLVGLLGGAGCILVAVVLLGPFGVSTLGAALLALGIGMPGLMVQDAWRYIFFAAGEGFKAFLNDVLWTVLLVGALPVALVVGSSSVAWAVLAFGFTAALAAAFGAWQSKALPRPSAVRTWLRSHRDLGVRFLGENLTRGLGGQFRSMTVAATVGLAAAGAVRGAEMMIAPAIMVLMGASQVAVPEAVGALNRGFDTLRRLCLLLSGALAALALVWGLVVLAAFPHGPGRLILGPVWDGAVVLLPGIIVSATVGCLSVGPVAGLRALERADLTMRAQMVVTPPAILACGGAGMLWGAQGAVWGAAAGAVFATLVWWHSFAVAKRDRATVAAPEDPLHKPRALADPPSTAATRLEPPGGVAGHGGRRRVAEG